MLPVQMDDISVLQHRCLLNLEGRIRDFGPDRPAEERCLRLQKDGDTLRSAGWNSPPPQSGWVCGAPLGQMVFFCFVLLFYIFTKAMDPASL